MLIYIATLGYLSYNIREMSLENAQKLTDSYADEYANFVMKELNGDMNIARTIKQSFLDYELVDKNVRDKIYNNTIKNVLIDNPQFIATSVSWELNAVDTSYKKPYGRVRTTFFREDGRIKHRVDSLELEGDVIGSTYYKIKVDKREIITPPYFFSYSNSKFDQILESSVAIPILNNEKFAGLVVIDIALDRFETMVSKIKPYKNSYAFLLANNGKFVAIPDNTYLNKLISELDPESNIKYNIIENVKNGKKFSFFKYDDAGKEYYVSFTPLQLGKSVTPWSIGIVVPVEEITVKAYYNLYISILVTILGLTLLTYIIWVISKEFSKPITETTLVLKELAKGDIELTKQLKIKRNDEIGEIKQSVNKLISGLNKTAEFASQIGQGNLDSKFEVLSKKDVLGNSLLEMRKSLERAQNEDKKRKEIDQKQSWATKGTARFGEILRENTDNINEFSYNIISNLVRYIDANQGGLYVINDKNNNDIYIELAACYAYNKRKKLTKKIPYGVGLIGRCIMEANKIYITNLPKDYINITSGLGGDSPSCILVVPLKFNENVLGVIEIASFKKLEPYKIEFIEKISESIASTISNVKINEKTVLLLEESKIQSEELTSHEEEMRQNMEEMRATQEELNSKIADISNILTSYKAISLSAEYNLSGHLINISNSYLKLLNLNKSFIIGEKHGSLISGMSYGSEKFEEFWADLRIGIKKRVLQHFHVEDKELWIYENYSPVYDNKNNIIKIICIAIDITKLVNQNQFDLTSFEN